jgi:hypothetical protein
MGDPRKGRDAPLTPPPEAAAPAGWIRLLPVGSEPADPGRARQPIGLGERSWSRSTSKSLDRGLTRSSFRREARYAACAGATSWDSCSWCFAIR